MDEASGRGMSAGKQGGVTADDAGRGGRTALVVYGCGTQGRVIIEMLAESESYREFQLTDDNPALWGSSIFSRPVMPPLEVLASAGRRFLCAIGGNAARREIFERLCRAGHAVVTLVHPAAIVSGSASLGAGTVVMARSVVNTEALVGAGCLLNTGCVVEHHCEVGDFAHLAPGVLLGGGVTVGANAFLGLGAVVLPNLTVGRDAVVGAGAVVIHDVPPGATVAGNPATILRPRVAGSRAAPQACAAWPKS